MVGDTVKVSAEGEEDGARKDMVVLLLCQESSEGKDSKRNGNRLVLISSKCRGLSELL
jgi:hypothetical protein